MSTGGTIWVLTHGQMDSKSSLPRSLDMDLFPRLAPGGREPQKALGGGRGGEEHVHLTKTQTSHEPRGRGAKPCTSGEHQNRWYIGVHPPQNEGIGYDPWPHGCVCVCAPLRALCQVGEKGNQKENPPLGVPHISPHAHSCIVPQGHSFVTSRSGECLTDVPLTTVDDG